MLIRSEREDEMDLGLGGKVALVTGGARGIGRGAALVLGAEGMKVAVNYAGNTAAAEETVAAIRAKGSEAEAFRADVGDREQVAGMIAGVMERFGRIDVLVNNAGIVSRKSILSVPFEEWDRVIATNLYGNFYCSRAVAPHMIERAEGGRIINISSIHGRVAKADMGPYCTTKAAIDMFTKQLAVELAPHRITVNSVGSGTISTDINIPLYKSTRPEDRALQDAVLKRIPQRRIGEPEDIGWAVAYLASAQAAYVTGVVLYVDGGYVAEGTPRI
jgi:3-oxoacyl-[acyl-carrier protein] reductase